MYAQLCSRPFPNSAVSRQMAYVIIHRLVYRWRGLQDIVKAYWFGRSPLGAVKCVSCSLFTLNMQRLQLSYLITFSPFYTLLTVLVLYNRKMHSRAQCRFTKLVQININTAKEITLIVFTKE